MKPANAAEELTKRIKASGTPMDELTPAQGLRIMLDFYRDVRAEGCDIDADGDMVLFQWGTYGEGKKRTFQFDLTRQFILEEDDDSVMSQLAFTFRFAPTAESDALESNNEWCTTPDELEDFEAFVTGSDAYQSVATVSPTKVTLVYGDV